jgi:hypothetical protein
MPNNEVVKSKRDLAMERIKAKYPDKSFDDDEAFFGQINDDYDDYDKQISESRGREEAFSNMFTSNPKSARLMMEWKNGNDPVAALIRIYGKEDILAAIEDPARLEAIEQANKEFAEKVAKNDEYDAQYEKNLPASIQAIEVWASEKGVSDEDIDDAVTALSKLCGDFILGKITTDSIEMMLKAKNYDADVEQAQVEGEVAGRNAKIEEKLRKGKKGDGTVVLDGKNGKTNNQPKRDLGALERYDSDSKSIFERGGEKRIQRR